MNPQPIEVPLDSDERAPGLARRAVRELVGEHPRTDDLLVCVSEVVTNAVTHGGGLVRLTVVVDGGVVVVTVVDAAPFAIPERQSPDVEASSGRGVQLLERLASDWGVETDGNEKIVWFEVRLSDGDRPNRLR